MGWVWVRFGGQTQRMGWVWVCLGGETREMGWVWVRFGGQTQRMGWVWVCLGGETRNMGWVWVFKKTRVGLGLDLVRKPTNGFGFKPASLGIRGVQLQAEPTRI